MVTTEISLSPAPAGAFFAGQQVTAGIGVATILADFDFETRSAAGYLFDSTARRWRKIRGVNAQGIPVCLRAYVEHPTFNVLSLAYDLKDGRGSRRWKPRAPQPLDLFEHVRAGKLIEAHNSEFEWNVWTYFCVPVLGWPAFPRGLRQLRCSMAKARAHALPGKLETLGTVLNLKKQKLKDGARLIDKFSKPRNPTKDDDSLWRDPEFDPVDGPKLYEYNERDIETEAEASMRIPDLSPTELEFWLLDQAVNDRGVRIDRKAVEDCIAIVEQAHEKYNTELCELTGGVVTAASELEALQAWLATQGVPMVAMDEECVQSALRRLGEFAQNHAGDLGSFRPAYRALEIRATLGSASVKKLFAIQTQSTKAGRLHSLYLYYAARTGRWTGLGAQPQNLYKGQFKNIAEIEVALKRIGTRALELIEFYYGDALEAVNGCLRSVFIPSEGHDFVCSDFTGIENVVGAALAGEEWVLDVYRSHAMMYEATAATITGIPFEDFVKHRLQSGGKAEYDAAGKLIGITGGKHHPMRNKLGKFAVLGSFFGGWIGAWKSFGADEYLTDHEIKQAILALRAKSPNYVETWGGQTRDAFDWNKSPRPELFGLEGAAIAAVQNPGYAYFGNRAQTITLQMHEDVLYMRCPGGGYLTYHEPRLNPSTRDWAQSWELELSFSGYNTNPKKGPVGWIRMKLYGGLLFENAVQHVARHIHATGMLNCERAGYKIVMHTHDEPCAEIEQGRGSVEEFEMLMCRQSEEFAGWPIYARGGWRGGRYGKFD